MQTLLSKALVATVTIASVGLIAAPQAQAVIIGGFGINGTVNLTPATGTTAPTTISGNILSSFLDQKTSAFDGASLGSPTFNPNPFTFARTATDPLGLYRLNAFSIKLTGVDGFAGDFILSVTPADNSFFRLGNSVSSSVANFIDVAATDNQGNGYFGSFSLSDTATSTGVFSLSFTSDDVPEPLTMLGASAAVAFGAAFKRRNANKG
ncbi:MAG: PEP-CTERM sorting domain-containing protein [Synechocystis sp.]